MRHRRTTLCAGLLALAPGLGAAYAQTAETTRSRDGKLVAYARTLGSKDGEDLVAIDLCLAATSACTRIVSPQPTSEPQTNISNISHLGFSYQAGIGADGHPVGSLFFITTGWATSGAIQRVAFGPPPRLTFVTDANGYQVIHGGPFAGALAVSQHRYGIAGQGSCEQNAVIDPNTRKRLAALPSPDCRGLTLR